MAALSLNFSKTGGFNPCTSEDESGHTAIQLAAVHGTVRAMEIILDHLRRMRELNSVYEAVDDHNRNVLMMAAAKGHLEIVKVLSNYQGLSKNQLWNAKDEDGKTARDYAVSRKRNDIVDFFDGKLVEEESEEDEEDEEDGTFKEEYMDMSKGKIKRAEEKPKQEEDDTSSKVEDIVPVWPEVKACLESAKLPDRKDWKRDLLINFREEKKKEGDDNDVSISNPPVPPPSDFVMDRALWRCATLHVLKLELIPGSVKAFPEELGLLKALGTLIISDNMIETLPESIKNLKSLKVLEAAGNAFKVLPEGLGECEKLEVIDVSRNHLTTLKPLSKLTQLVTVHANDNELENLEGLEFTNLERLVDLSCSNNMINTLSDDIGALCGSLMMLNVSSNKLEEVPSDLGNLQKKLQKLLTSDNPIKDPRVRKNLKKAEKGGRDLKEALKFLAKQKKKGGKKGKKKRK